MFSFTVLLLRFRARTMNRMPTRDDFEEMKLRVRQDDFEEIRLNIAEGDVKEKKEKPEPEKDSKTKWCNERGYDKWVTNPHPPIPRPHIPLANSKTLPSNLKYVPVTFENICAFKHCCQSYLPLPYPDVFFKSLLKPNTAVKAALAVIDDKQVIGCVSWKANDYGSDVNCLVLGVRFAYRRRGVGRDLWRHMLDENPFVRRVSLHCQTENYSAVEFYQGLGFEAKETKVNYYPRLDHPDAYYMEWSWKGEKLVDERSATQKYVESCPHPKYADAIKEKDVRK